MRRTHPTPLMMLRTAAVTHETCWTIIPHGGGLIPNTQNVERMLHEIANEFSAVSRESTGRRRIGNSFPRILGSRNRCFAQTNSIASVEPARTHTPKNPHAGCDCSAGRICIPVPVAVSAASGVELVLKRRIRIRGREDFPVTDTRVGRNPVPRKSMAGVGTKDGYSSHGWFYRPWPHASCLRNPRSRGALSAMTGIKAGAGSSSGNITQVPRKAFEENAPCAACAQLARQRGK